MTFVSDVLIYESLCVISVLCVSVVSLFRRFSPQRHRVSQRSHRKNFGLGHNSFVGAADLTRARAGRLSACRFLAFGIVVCGLSFVSPAPQLVSAKAKNAQTQMQLNKESCDEYKKVDAEMNAVYRRITRDYRQNQVFISALKKAQLAWIGYRDAQVESIFPGDPSQYGSISTMCRCNNLTELTKARTEILNRWIEGVEEGDVCAGSVKIKSDE
jgi:uncharacterized protein YecT (DUF1311 family)